MSKTAMYVFINKGLGMSTGKCCAQAAHAAVEAYTISDPDLIKQWRLGEHYTKLVMQARDTAHLINIKKYISSRGFKSKLIIDEGITEIDSHTPTALGVEIVDKEDEHTLATFSTFELYKDSIRVSFELER